MDTSGRREAGGGQAGSVDEPGVAAAEEGGQVAVALSFDGFVELLAHQLVVRRALHLAEDADRRVLEARRVEPRQSERRRRVGGGRGVDGDVVRARPPYPAAPAP